MENIMNFDLDRVLDMMGLARRRSSVGAVFAAVGLFAVGAAVGASAGLAFAPSSGRRLRQEVGDKLDQIRERVIKTELRQKNAVNAAPQQSS